MSNSRRGRIDLIHAVWLSHKVGWKVKSIPVMQWRLKGNADVGKDCNEGTGILLVASVRQFESVRFESVRVSSVRVGSVRVSSVRVSSDRFESSMLQGELGSIQDELITLLHIFLNNWKWWKRCVNVVYCDRVDGEKSEAIRWCCKVGWIERFIADTFYIVGHSDILGNPNEK